MEVKYVDKHVKPLTYATDGSGAWDLRSAEDNFEIPAFGEAVIHTGVAIWLEENNRLGQVIIRSGLSKHLTLRNGTGWIDSDYQGEIILCLINRTQDPFPISFNDRLCQITIVKIYPPQEMLCEVVTNFSKETKRGTKGHGSSGVK